MSPSCYSCGGPTFQPRSGGCSEYFTCVSDSPTEFGAVCYLELPWTSSPKGFLGDLGSCWREAEPMCYSSSWNKSRLLCLSWLPSWKRVRLPLSVCSLASTVRAHLHQEQHRHRKIIPSPPFDFAVSSTLHLCHFLSFRMLILFLSLKFPPALSWAKSVNLSLPDFPLFIDFLLTVQVLVALSYLVVCREPIGIAAFCRAFYPICPTCVGSWSRIPKRRPDRPRSHCPPQSSRYRRSDYPTGCRGHTPASWLQYTPIHLHLWSRFGQTVQ